MKSKFKNFDFLSFFKPCLIAFAIVVFVGAILFGIFGLNTGFDFVGGTQLVVEFPYDDTDSEVFTKDGWQQTANTVSQIINKQGVKINSFQEQGEYSYKSFVITLKTKNENDIYQIRLDINKELNSSSVFSQLASRGEEYKILEDDGYSLHDITKKTTYIDSLISPTAIITTASTLLFAVVVCLIYALFRVKVAGALAIIISSISSVLLTIAFVAITRIEVNTYLFVCLGLVEFAALMTTVDFLFGCKQKLKDPLLTDKTNEQIANSVVHENFVKTLLTYICSAAACVIFGLFGVLSILKLSLVGFIGLAVSFGFNLFVMPALYAKMAKKRNLVKPVYVSSEADKDADVIEIDDEAENNK
ncbi:MAG: hypothetical protein IJD48_00510 [Clostridia bacterium]|nr:hypothetical protein [Clostridia bacterium]